MENNNERKKAVEIVKELNFNINKLKKLKSSKKMVKNNINKLLSIKAGIVNKYALKRNDLKK